MKVRFCKDHKDIVKEFMFSMPILLIANSYQQGFKMSKQKVFVEFDSEYKFI